MARTKVSRPRKRTAEIVTTAPGTPSGALERPPRKKSRLLKDKIFTPALGARICNEVASGLSRRAVCGKIGVTPLRLDTWLEASAKGELPNGEDFYDEFVAAECEGQAFHEEQFLKMAQDRTVKSANVRAQHIFLSYRFQDWKQQKRVEHTGKDGGPIGVGVLHGTVYDFLRPAHEVEITDRRNKLDALKSGEGREMFGERHDFEDPLEVIRRELQEGVSKENA